MLIRTFTFEQVAKLVQQELQKSVLLHYIDDSSIVFSSESEKQLIPTFKDYCIHISAPDSGFLEKIPKIGNYYQNNYSLAIELWVKSSSQLANRLNDGNLSKNIGIFEVFQNISDTLEHNTLGNELRPYAGSNIGPPKMIPTDDKLVEGIVFFWFGSQLNTK